MLGWWIVAWFFQEKSRDDNVTRQFKLLQNTQVVGRTNFLTQTARPESAISFNPFITIEAARASSPLVGCEGRRSDDVMWNVRIDHSQYD